MMGLPLYASLLAGWMGVSVIALLATGAPLVLRALLAGLLLALCGVAGSLAPTIAQAFMDLGPALALCVHVASERDADIRGVVLAFILAGNAALAVAFGRCDLLFVTMGAGLAVRLGLAHGPRGLDRAGWQALRIGLGGLVMAQGGLSVLQVQWGSMADQAGAVLLVGGVLLACGILADPVTVPMAGAPLAQKMNTLAALPVVAHAAGMWPTIQPVLTFLGLLCLLWSVLPRGGDREPVIAWGAWAVMAAGLPGGVAALPLAACLLAVACMQVGATAMPAETAPPWPPFLPGVALVLVFVGLMEHSAVVAVLAAIGLWPVMRRCRAAMMGQTIGMRGTLSLGLGCMVLAAIIHHGGVGP
ncbi:hypothetical protein D3W54_11725 [Komagataeibacter medellinensis]|uniref:Uncharacterized protein n=1 Tax=Komagataeibacter medellinensis TaxID=1177712 RepID=A0ABQ6VX23_9PROT|nr:hypothetical protein [Komagataeibacter medellinensis]KAB8124740.1 hypothetical protein D3W54_11725 [Komagataeibacter medellinensis]